MHTSQAERRTLEVRTLVVARAELRIEDQNGRRLIVGYACRFNSWSEDLGGFIERVRPGAFARCLANAPDVRFLVNHNRDLVLGRTVAGTLRLVEDGTGLRAECLPPDSEMGRNYVESVRRGDISGMSFRFYTKQDAWDYATNPARRELRDIDVDDVCLATYPAYTDTTVAVRGSNRPKPAMSSTPSRNLAHRRLLLANGES